MHHRHHPNRPQNSNLPRHPAPGGPSTPKIRPQKASNRIPNRPAPSSDEPERKSRFASFRERFKEKEATPEEVEQLRLQAEREKFKYNKKYYKHSQKEIGGQMFRQGSYSPSRGRQSRPQSGFGMGNSILDSRPTSSGPIFGGLDSAFGSHSSRPPSKRGRPKVEPQRGFGSGLSSMFGI